MGRKVHILNNIILNKQLGSLMGRCFEMLHAFYYHSLLNSLGNRKFNYIKTCS